MSVVSLTVGTETVVVRLVTVVVVEEFQLIMFVESMVVFYTEDCCHSDSVLFWVED